MTMGIPTRNFFKELSELIGLNVKVTTMSGATYTGIFRGYDANTLSICLINGKNPDGESFEKIFLFGHHIFSILPVGKPFDFEGFIDRLLKYQIPKEGITYLKEEKAIVILNKVRVTENGVEGSGPIAERVKKIYDEYIEEIGGKE